MKSLKSHNFTIPLNVIKDEIINELKTQETEQEELAEEEITPLHLQFWKPENILSVEDTPFSNRYLVSLLVISFSILGNLSRISLQKLTNYENAYINYSGGTVVWVNFAACFVMSWANNGVGFWSHILENSGKTSLKQLALHAGITVGYCGSFSTLSSSMIEIFFKTLNIVEGNLPNNGYKVMEFFSVSLTTFAIPILGYILGKHFAVFFDNFMVPHISNFLKYQNIRILELTFALLGVIALIANLVLTCTLSVNYWYKNTYAYAILAGAIGAILRFKLSKFNGKFFQPWFPTGTLIANFVGCLFIAVLELLIHGYKYDNVLIVENKVQQFILNGFAAGLCGSLTTMSSFINELYNLGNPWFQHIYFWSTFTPCFIVILLIDGTYVWTKGFQIIT
jgi:fluoride ion exporter CrcB/FEX